MTHWQYKVIYYSDSCRSWGGSHQLDPNKLNELGQGGWELVATFSTNTGRQIVFKRPVLSDAQRGLGTLPMV